MVALHMQIVAVAQHFKLETVSGKRCCGNTSALEQSSKTRKQVSPGIKHTGVHCLIQTLKCILRMDMTYIHVRTHQDRILPCSMLTLEQQLM